MKDTQSKKVEKIHFEVQGWKSNLHFMEDETIFIDRLLKSSAFEPNIHNLFERLQEYLHQLNKIEKSKIELQKSISQYENKLAEMMESNDTDSETKYYRKYDTLEAKVVDYMIKFRALKLEIFNYIGGVLKK